MHETEFTTLLNQLTGLALEDYQRAKEHFDHAKNRLSAEQAELAEAAMKNAERDEFKPDKDHHEMTHNEMRDCILR